MGAAQIAVNVSTIGRSQPATEREARPLRTLSPDDQRVAWQVVTETAPEGKITAGHVQSVVNALKDIQETRLFNPDTKQEPEKQYAETGAKQRRGGR
jgi:hypothetical protein